MDAVEMERIPRATREKTAARRGSCVSERCGIDERAFVRFNGAPVATGGNDKKNEVLSIGKDLTGCQPVIYIESFKTISERRRAMLKSPCLTCDRAQEDKNKCIEDCEKLKEYQELILKQGIYATM
jgi:hypothetical protein